MKILATILFNCCITIVMAHPGVGIVMDSNGNVFYTDTERVLKIDASGRKSVVIPNVHTHELYLDANDNLYGEHLWYEGSTDSWGHYVWRYSAAGRFQKIKPDTKGFLEDYSFARDHLGNLFWAIAISLASMWCAWIAGETRLWWAMPVLKTSGGSM